MFPSYTHDVLRRESDPINLIFDNATCEKVIGELKWSGRTFWWDHTIKIGNKFVRQTAQKVNGPLCNRYHLRIWEYGPSQCVANAHHEKLSWVRHVVTSHEMAKEKIAGHFLGKSWTVMKNAHNLDNFEGEDFSNGMATEIRR